MILEVDTRSPVPPYEQLRAQIAALVGAGALAPGTRLPPIRQLANDLGLAGGTVARAYRELESEGVVRTRGRHGTEVVAATASAAGPATSPRLAQAAARFVRDVRRAGGGVDEALAAVRAAWATAGPR